MMANLQIKRLIRKPNAARIIGALKAAETRKANRAQAQAERAERDRLWAGIEQLAAQVNARRNP